MQVHTYHITSRTREQARSPIDMDPELDHTEASSSAAMVSDVHCIGQLAHAALLLAAHCAQPEIHMQALAFDSDSLLANSSVAS